MKSKNDIYKIMSIVFLLDQIIKFIVCKTMSLYQRIVIFPNFFSIFYVQNTGAAFSILENHTILIVFISVFFLLLLGRYIKKETHYTILSIFSLGFILGGIFGNLFDRIIYRAVIDYLAFSIFTYEAPVFNLADMAITIGIAIFTWNILFEKKKEGSL